MKQDRKRVARDAGWAAVRGSVVLGGLVGRGRGGSIVEPVRGDGWAVLGSNGQIDVNTDRGGDPAEWAWVFAHLLLHLGLGHVDEDRLAEARAVLPDGRIDPVYSAVCCVAVNRLAEVVRVGRSPTWLPDPPGGDESDLLARWREIGVPQEFRGCGTGGSGPCLVAAVWSPYSQPVDWQAAFARGLAKAADDAIEQAAQARGQRVGDRKNGPWDRALSWFVSSYPLLGALAAGMTVIADADLARSWEISIAAVDAASGEIYVNPHAALSAEEWRFVMAHEMLHAALRHGDRSDGRDHYLWNVACDYVINGWLMAMGVGELPDGSLFDQALTGLSAESVYDTLVTDLRRARKLVTLGGKKAGDVLGDWLTEPGAAQRRGSRRAAVPGRLGGVELDDFYRRALTTGLEYHRAQGRGLVPAGLEQESRALEHPPLPWDARLARWFDEYVRSPEMRRSYARPSRRQSSTPDIPRPGVVHPSDPTQLPTFGVVLDTSGSMNAELLGKALGAIASYALARDVPAARVVYCDAVAYDAGYVPVQDISGRVRVRGRGGTVLQRGVDVLQRAEDFPVDGPILVITDGACDVVRVRREHAFLVSGRLPFVPRGPVFRVS
ncbi:hypothetical protein NLX83_29320 [Allokutzneria sp. A3M-2-11 16]|uniref:vWA domain-containing protein n=1 Tax=Allokutzneria sp. A3M-2-11 16 TaxID=2962043 RepID=UPI0020B6A13E|nr:hypothetical protein [Allokutzneria sp. A3M-2-11 16]MCP3803382.1 hypothetical protein [Allokutzneria sp. A3M-2-11 16]